MSDISEKIKEIEANTTPIECINDIIESLEMLYCEENNTRLPKELSEFSGSIFVAYKQAKLLKTKL